MDRKRLGKYLGLGAGLALCFALSGCYIAPDDINTGTPATTGGALPFQTLAPTATVAVTPDTVVIATPDPNSGSSNVWGNTGNTAQQTIQVTNSATATPTPDSGSSGGSGWSGWGTVAQTGEAQQTPTPVGSTVVFQTPTPSGTGLNVVTPTPKATIQVVTKAPATSTPTPKSLQVGFKDSDEVKALQKRLRELGYYSGSVDGDFGTGTEEAVKAFQKANGLKADGKAGAQTLAKLNSKNAISKRQANATPTPKKTAKPTTRVTATPRPTATPNLSKEYYLQTGSSGKKVKTLQNRLIELGYLSGKATGEYDAATRAAVVAFQKKTKGLWDDGVAGPDTLAALYSANAAKASGVAASTGETLQLGDEGSEVRALQKRLKELGYLSGAIDGSYGAATEAAVRAFQQMNGLTADGKAGNATLNALYAQDAIRANGNSSGNTNTNSNTYTGNNTGTNTGTNTNRNTSSGNGRTVSDVSSTGYTTLKTGSEGQDVRALQSRLKELGYYSGAVDGSYGEDTVAAVLRFQLRNNLTVDGKAGPATQRVLYGNSGNVVSYSALREGENGQAVRQLQYTLYELGYYDGSIDGDYGQSTADAVRAFQIQNNLKPVDGVAGTDTMAKLYSASAVPASAAKVDYETAREGMSGELVVEIQDCLKQMGYLEKITGVYDDATVEAVKQFQKAKGLTVDGVAGENTLIYLFGY